MDNKIFLVGLVELRQVGDIFSNLGNLESFLGNKVTFLKCYKIITFLTFAAQNARKQVHAAVNFWQANTCIRFQENGSGRNRIRFFEGQGCYSGVGRNLEAGEQSISIGKGCDTVSSSFKGTNDS